MTLHPMVTTAASENGRADPLPIVTSPTAPAVLQGLAKIERWARDQDIICQDGTSEAWYCVISGAARQCVISPEGRRQIVDILLPGDFFGFTLSSAHRFAVQAVVDDTIVASYSCRRIQALAQQNPHVAQDIQLRLVETVSRLQEHILVVGTMTATQKVRAFLAFMSERLPSAERWDVSLPISRYDIADHLGISVETVSRAITDLRATGIIRLDGPRHVSMVPALSSAWPVADGPWARGRCLLRALWPTLGWRQRLCPAERQSARTFPAQCCSPEMQGGVGPQLPFAFCWSWHNGASRD